MPSESPAVSGKRLSVVVLADVGSDHFHVGDEAMLEANLKALRRYAPAARAAVFGRCTAEVAELDELAATLASADALFISGGGNLRSSWPVLVEQRIFALGEARRRGIPIVTGGQTIGPELTAGQRAALVEAFGDVEHLGVRELTSAATALAMGVRADRLAYQVDDAFLLAGAPPADAAIRSSLDEPFIALTLDPFFAASSRSLREIASQLAMIAHGSRLRIVFVPHVGPLGEVGHDDGRVGTALRAMFRARNVAYTVLPVMPTAQTIWCTQRAAAVVSSRYHPLVFGTSAGVPSLGIHTDAYTRIKLQGALAHVGMAAWSQSADAAAAGGLLTDFHRLWRERHAMRTTMQRARKQIAVREDRRWRTVQERLGLTPPVADRSNSLPPLIGWRRRKRNTLERMTTVTEQMWSDYRRDGFVRLGAVLDPGEVAALRERADELATGRISNPGVQVQTDTGGAYDALAAASGAPLSTLRYRKIQGVETDDRFAPLVRHPLFLEIAARHYGAHAPVSIFRAMVMNKPAELGTFLPWHQDGGDVWALDRDPLVTIWVALDRATVANGCVEVIPGSHRLGLLSSFGSTLRDEDAARHCPEHRIVPLEVEAGHAVLMHNWLIHRSGVNPSTQPRRAFTACYMDGRTRNVLTCEEFPMVAGASPQPLPYLQRQREHVTALEERLAVSEAYAASLNEHNTLLRKSRDEVTTYAMSLERELGRVQMRRENAERYAASLESEREISRSARSA